MKHMTTKPFKKKQGFNSITEASFLKIHMSHPFLTTYQNIAQTSRDIFYNIPSSPNSLNSQVHEVCLIVKSCVYSPIFLDRSQPRLPLVYLKSIQKNQICTRLFGCTMDHTSCAWRLTQKYIKENEARWNASSIGQK
jgi:hypothetical protein